MVDTKDAKRITLAVLEEVDEDVMFDYIRTYFDPEDVFDRSELEDWAGERYGFQALKELENGR